MLVLAQTDRQRSTLHRPLKHLRRCLPAGWWTVAKYRGISPLSIKEYEIITLPLQSGQTVNIRKEQRDASLHAVLLLLLRLSSNRNHRSPVSCWTSNWKYIMTEHNRIMSNLLLVQHKVSVTWRDGEFIVRRLSLRIRRVFDVVILEFDRMATWVHSRLPRRRKTVYDRLLVITKTARYSLLFKNRIYTLT